jgi:uncharacterized phage-associated protein
MSYPAEAIANYFIGKSITNPKTSLTPLKLIKLVYVAHGWYLAHPGIRLGRSKEAKI